MKQIIRKAFLIENDKYRFWLSRVWDESLPLILFIGLNPSTANSIKDDPTIRRLINFANTFGYGGMYMANLFPLVSACPDMLYSYYDTHQTRLYSEENLNNISLLSGHCNKIVFCWGAFNILKVEPGNMNYVINLFPGAYCFGQTKEGYPKHPLYLKSDTQLVKFNKQEFQLKPTV